MPATEFSVASAYTAPPTPSPGVLRRMCQLARIRQKDIAQELGVTESRISLLFEQKACTPRVAQAVMKAIIKLQSEKRG